MNKNFLTLLSMLLLATSVYATSIDAVFLDNITLFDKPISAELYLYNSTSTPKQITLKANTSPFSATFSENQFVLKPGESKRISVTINQLADSLDVAYNSSIEITSADYYKKLPFTITQRSNRACQIVLRYTINYLPATDNYKLELFFKNDSKTDKTIEIIGLKDINLSSGIGVIDIPKESEVSTVRIFSTDDKTAFLEYRCNGVYGKMEMNLPDKENPEEIASSTGLFSFITNINFLGILDSLVFQVILIVILMLLVLSFSARYIKYVYKK